MWRCCPPKAYPEKYLISIPQKLQVVVDGEQDGETRIGKLLNPKMIEEKVSLAGGTIFFIEEIFHSHFNDINF